jgi:hypothetical protein
MNVIWRELLSFFKSHWPHLLIALPAAFLITIIHESAHAAAVVLQGGELLEFSPWPSEGEWGHVEFKFASGSNFSPAAIALAPYAVCLAACALAWLLAMRRKAYPVWLASLIFIWLYVAPLGEIANAAVPYLGGESNDLTEPFGPPTAGKWLGVIALIGVSSVLGFPLQRRLYGVRALSGQAYMILCVATLAALLTMILLV